MTSELTLQTPLHSLTLEAQILGTLLMEPRMLETVLPILKVDDFHSPVNQVIYNTVLQVFNDNVMLDEILLVERLLAQPHRGHGSFKNQLEYVGGPVYIIGLTKKVTSSANIREHAFPAQWDPKLGIHVT